MQGMTRSPLDPQEPWGGTAAHPSSLSRWEGHRLAPHYSGASPCPGSPESASGGEGRARPASGLHTCRPHAACVLFMKTGERKVPPELQALRLSTHLTSTCASAKEIAPEAKATHPPLTKRGLSIRHGGVGDTSLATEGASSDAMPGSSPISSQRAKCHHSRPMKMRMPEFPQASLGGDGFSQECT